MTMKKPIVPRIIGLLVLYGAVFVLLAMIQFAKQGGFTRRIGKFVVTGQYRAPESGEAPVNQNVYLLTGETRVFFGGLEFSLIGDDKGESFSLITAQGERESVLPRYMTVSGEGAIFSFPEGTELMFVTQYTGGKQGLRISVSLGEETEGLRLPYKPLKTSRIRENGDGSFVVLAGGESYSFGYAPLDEERRVLLLQRNGTEISYRALPEKKAFEPEDFIIPPARDKQNYEEVLSRWRDLNYSLWNRLAANTADEDLVIAYGGEAVRRGTYRSAIAGISADFLKSPGRTFQSAVYLGQTDMGLRSLSALEREKISRLSRLINEKSPDFLKEPHVFEYFALRGYGNFIDDGAALVHAMDPVTLVPDISLGILEGFLDWKLYRPHGDNPFTRLIDQACFVISETIWKNTGENLLLAFSGDGTAYPEFNLRLGKILSAYGEDTGSESWAALGRSLILSILSLENNGGTIPGGFRLSETGGLIENAALPRISTARLYRILALGEYSPRVLGIGAAVNGIWAWTAASALGVTQENNILDISVSFPAGETHYMIIRGVKPFAKVQLYNMDFRTDLQFERYDSSGWFYSAQEQTLLLKMKHRTTVEHIKLFY
ncbi:MAG: hypothetical protein LBT93_06470 [Treponema sp.]|jgi:hypothetical protein|nr:hypothetical protein [Treponema sp.]